MLRIISSDEDSKLFPKDILIQNSPFLAMLNNYNQLETIKLDYTLQTINSFFNFIQRNRIDEASNIIELCQLADYLLYPLDKLINALEKHFNPNYDFLNILNYFSVYDVDMSVDISMQMSIESILDHFRPIYALSEIMEPSYSALLKALKSPRMLWDKLTHIYNEYFNIEYEIGNYHNFFMSNENIPQSWEDYEMHQREIKQLIELEDRLNELLFKYG